MSRYSSELDALMTIKCSDMFGFKASLWDATRHHLHGDSGQFVEAAYGGHSVRSDRAAKVNPKSNVNEEELKRSRTWRCASDAMSARDPDLFSVYFCEIAGSRCRRRRKMDQFRGCSNTESY